MSDIEFRFFHVGRDSLLPDLLVRSIRLTNPGSRIVHLSDHITPGIRHVDEVHRVSCDENMMLSRARAYCDLPLNESIKTIFLDTDMLVIGRIFAREFQTSELTLCRRYFNRGSLVNVDFRGMGMTEYAGMTLDEAWPYLGCFMLAESIRPLKMIYDEMMSLPAKYLVWYGDQIALKRYAAANPEKVLEVSESVFGALPDGLMETRHNSRNVEAKVLHFKGARKSLMLDYAKAFNIDLGT